MAGLILSEMIWSIVKESSGLPGARTLGRRASWTEDSVGREIPELKLNRLLVAEAFLQLLASGIGTLALVWATVVLLGGYSTMLVRTDFWFTTAIVFIETARIVGYNSGAEPKYVVDALAGFTQKNILGIRSAGDVFRRITLVPALIALAPIYAAIACMTLSIVRLVGISRHHYGGSSTDASNGNLKPALILFYTLVLTQGSLFFWWFIVATKRSANAREFSREYFGNIDRTELIDRYVTSTLDTCIEKGVVSTINSTLVSFAAELLQSEHGADYVTAVSVLHSMITRRQRTAGVVGQICASEHLVGRLIRMLSSKSPLDRDDKSCAAEIVAKIACNLRLADIPAAVHSISSLLDARFMKTAAQTGHNGHPQPPGESNSLIVHGLMILDELAGDPGNCAEMYTTPDLVHRIIAPLNQQMCILIGNDGTSADIVKASLSVVAKLTRGADETTRCLRGKISDNARTAGNILWILSNGSDQDMKILAVEILTRLTLGEPRTDQFIGVLRRLLFDAQDSRLRTAAGKALNVLAVDRRNFQMIIGRQVGGEHPDIQQLVTIISAHGNYEYRAGTAELLAQICAKSITDQDRNRLRSVSNALSTVLRAIITETTNHTEHDRRVFIASFLGLALQICDKLAITADAFTNAVAGIPMEDVSFIMKLMEIVQTSNNGGDDVCLVIMKNTTKLATWMMGLNPRYVLYFRQENILRKLEIAVEAMPGLEWYMAMTWCADETENYETLRAIVERARNLVLA